MTPIHPQTYPAADDVESVILHVVAQRESCTLDELLLTLSNFTFNQVLISVDRLSREGRVTLRRPTQFTYLISHLPAEPRSQPHTEGSREGHTHHGVNVRGTIQ